MKYTNILLYALNGILFLFCASAPALENYYLFEDFSNRSIDGDSSELTAKNIYMSGRGVRLNISNGGKVLCDELVPYGDATQGIVYSELRNGVTVSGVGSLLRANNALSLSSYYCPGAPGLSLGLAREIPTFLHVSGGGEVWVGETMAIANSSWVSVGDGSRLSIGSGCSSGGVLEVAADGTLDIRLGGYEHETAGWPDRLNVLGDADLDGTLKLTFQYGFSPTNGACFDLFNWGGSVNGQFSATELPMLSDGLGWDTAELYSSGQVSVIPEPGVVRLFALFGVGILVKRRLWRV